MFGQLADDAEPAAGAGFVAAVPDCELLGVVVDVELSAAYAAAAPPPRTAAMARAAMAGLSPLILVPPSFVLGGHRSLKRIDVRSPLDPCKN
jgi:hypothetical protein